MRQFEQIKALNLHMHQLHSYQHKNDIDLNLQPLWVMWL